MKKNYYGTYAKGQAAAASFQLSELVDLGNKKTVMPPELRKVIEKSEYQYAVTDN